MSFRIVLSRSAYGFSTLMLLLAAGPAQAQAPSNDLISDAKELVSLPFEDEVDTSTATRSATDPYTWYGGVGPTVWYRYTPSVNTIIEFQASSLDFAVSLGVFVGEPNEYSWPIDYSYTYPESGPATVRLWVAAGTTYWFMLEDYYWSAGTGGTASVTARELVPAEVTLSISPTGSVNTKTGVATVAVTLETTAPVYVYGGYGELVQRSGRMLYRSQTYINPPYEVLDRHQVLVEFRPTDRLFGPGWADVRVSIPVYDPVSWDYRYMYAEQSVQLKSAKK